MKKFQQPETLEELVLLLSADNPFTNIKIKVLCPPCRFAKYDAGKNLFEIVFDTTSSINTSSYAMNTLGHAINDALGYEPDENSTLETYDKQYGKIINSAAFIAYDMSNNIIDSLIKLHGGDTYFQCGDDLIRAAVNSGQFIVESDWATKTKLESIPENAKILSKDKFFTLLNAKWRDETDSMVITFNGIKYMTLGNCERADDKYVAHQGRILYTKSDYYDMLPHNKIKLYDPITKKFIKNTRLNSCKDVKIIDIINGYDEAE